MRRDSACMVYKELRDGVLMEAWKLPYNTIVIFHLRKKSRSLVHRCLVYPVCVTGVTRQGKALINLTRITTIKRFS